MRFEVVGSSSAWPIPRIGCRCPQCEAARTGGPDRRTRASLLAADGRLLVDFGIDFHQQWRDREPAFEAVLQTHTHSDHYLGFAEIWGTELTDLPVYAAAGNWERIEGTFRHLVPRGRVRRHDLEPAVSFLAAGVRVTPFEVEHVSDFTTVGFCFESAEGRRLAYAPDMVRPTAAALEILRGVDVFLLDGTYQEPGKNHQTLSDGVALCRSVGVARGVFTHIGHFGLTHAELSAHLAKMGPFEAAYDGMVVEL